MAEKNMSESDRIVSGIAAVGLLGAATVVRRHPAVAAGLGVLAGVLAVRGATGYCPAFALTGFSSRPWTGAQEPAGSQRQPAGDPVEIASEDSFPASDAPSWTV